MMHISKRRIEESISDRYFIAAKDIKTTDE